VDQLLDVVADLEGLTFGPEDHDLQLGVGLSFAPAGEDRERPADGVEGGDQVSLVVEDHHQGDLLVAAVEPALDDLLDRIRSGSAVVTRDSIREYAEDQLLGRGAGQAADHHTLVSRLGLSGQVGHQGFDLGRKELGLILFGEEGLRGHDKGGVRGLDGAGEIFGEGQARHGREVCPGPCRSARTIPVCIGLLMV
jgi:hypothetical protein